MTATMPEPGISADDLQTRPIEHESAEELERAEYELELGARRDRAANRKDVKYETRTSIPK